MKPERNLSESKVDFISRKELKALAQGIVLAGMLGGCMYLASEAGRHDKEKYEQYDRNRWADGGFTIVNEGDNVRRITLLPWGKEKGDPVHKEVEDISEVTLQKAVNKIKESCTVVSEKKITERIILETMTIGELVTVKDCK